MNDVILKISTPSDSDKEYEEVGLDDFLTVQGDSETVDGLIGDVFLDNENLTESIINFEIMGFFLVGVIIGILLVGNRRFD